MMNTTKRTDLCQKCGDSLGKGEMYYCAECNEHELYLAAYAAGAADYKAKYENALREKEVLQRIIDGLINA